MVLEVFLLIYMSGSSSFETESNNLCLFGQSNPCFQIETILQNTDASEVNNDEYIIDPGGGFNKPDSINKSDSAGLQKRSVNHSDSVHAVVTLPGSLAKSNLVTKIASEFPKVENVSELPKPEFALKFEQNNTNKFTNLPSNSLEIRKLHSNPDIFEQNRSIQIKNKISPRSKTNNQQDWFTIILISAIVLIAWIRAFFGRYFQQSVQSLYDFTLSIRLFKNKNILLPRISFLLLVNFIIITSLFAFKSLEIIKISAFKSSFSNFLILNVIFLTLITFRLVIFHSLNILFPRNQTIMEYHYQVQNFYKSIGLLILPVLIFATYFPASNGKLFVWCGLSLIIILYAYRLFRGQGIIRRMHMKFSYVFLYVITFEILPISICFKIFSEII
jgi:hypothetical protein